MQTLGVTKKWRMGHSNDRKMRVDKLGGWDTMSMNKLNKIKEWEQEGLSERNEWLTNRKQQLVTPG